MPDTARKTFLAGLRDAYAMEKQAKDMMANQAAKSVAAKTAAAATPTTQAQATTVAAALPANIPVPMQNPLAYAAPEPAPQETADATKKPFWKFWARN